MNCFETRRRVFAFGFAAISLTVAAGNVLAQEPGLSFVCGIEWPAILAQAAKEQKLILVAWSEPGCRPCDDLHRRILARPEVGDSLNPIFVAVTLRADSAPALRKHYQVATFPTLLFLDETGQVLGTISGKQSATTVLAEAAAAIDQYVRTSWGLNNRSWALFKASADSAELQAAAKWMERLLRLKHRELQQASDPRWRGMDPMEVDTYANLLYKLGRVEEAITWEEKAIALVAEGRGFPGWALEFQANLERMRRGEPTWPSP